MSKWSGNKLQVGPSLYLVFNKGGVSVYFRGLVKHRAPGPAAALKWAASNHTVFPEHLAAPLPEPPEEKR